MPEAAPPPAAGATPATGAFQDPYRNYNFKLEIQGVTQGHFTSCSNIGVRIQAIQYREGGAQQIVHKLPGPVEYADIQLRYGLTSSMDLWNWFMSAARGAVERKNVSIGAPRFHRGDGGGALNLTRAWPREWNGAPLDARGHEVAIETLTLVFETLERG